MQCICDYVYLNNTYLPISILYAALSISEVISQVPKGCDAGE